jgi:uncharacterized protein (TIGR02646 family)
MHKPALRALLHQEQHNLCIFCEVEIDEGRHTPRIDHWRPMSVDLNEVFTWDNLHLSCVAPYSCDVRKQNTPLKWLAADPDLPWPAQFRYEDVLGFTSGGRIYVRSDLQLPDVIRLALQVAIDDHSQNGKVREAILNLNTPALRTARVAAIEDEETALLSVNGGQQASQEQRDARALSILSAVRRPGFAGVRLAYLRGELGRGQP